MSLTRDQVIAHRVAATGLHRKAKRVADVEVLDLGLRESPGQPAALALVARVVDADAAVGASVGPGHDLALAWTMRGAPHVHRRADLNRVARGLYPLSEDDAVIRINGTPKTVAAQGIPAREQYHTAVAALRDAVPRSTGKGDASTAATEALPESMRHWCRTCQVEHIADPLMRVAGLAAGLEIEPDTSPPVLRRRARAVLPKRPDPKAFAELVRAYLRFLGPAGPTEVATWLGARRADVAEHWPGDLVEVTVGRRQGWLPADVDVASAPDPELIRLLPPYDPYLQSRDRDLVVPNKAFAKQLWPAIGPAGAVFVDGEVVGVWRTKAAGKRLKVTVDVPGRTPKRVWNQVDDEAQRVAAARGYAEADIVRA